MRVIVAKLPIICKRPRQRPQHMDMVFPDGLEDLGHERQIVRRARSVEQLVRESLVGLVPDREAELGDYDGVFEGVPKVGEVCAEVGRGGVDVGLGAVADVPAEGCEGGLVDAVGEERVGGVGAAGGDAVAGWRDSCCCIRIDAEEVCCSVEVLEVCGCQRNIVRDRLLEGIWVVEAEVDWIAECGQLEVVEVVGSSNIGRVGWVEGYPEIVVELHSHLPRPLDLVMVEVIEPRVGFEYVVD